MPPLCCLLFENYPIFEQLQIEEYLFRASSKDYLLINYGSSDAIVLGRTNCVDQLIDNKTPFQRKIPLIRRYSAGGTVLVDSKTLFTSLILSKSTLMQNFPHFFPENEIYPENLTKWHFKLTQPLFDGLPFHLNEQDLCLEEKKIAGQAQAFARKRVVHHSTFLIDYDLEKMQRLKMPSKQPKYRQRRTHEDFLCSIERETGLTAASLIDKTLQRFGLHFQVEVIDCKSPKNHSILEQKARDSSHRKETRLLSED